MLSRMLSVVAVTILMVSVGQPSFAATIKYVGSTDKPDEATHWRTASVKKTLDIDSDNIFGTIGAVIWGHGSVGEQQAGSTTLGWVYVGGGAQFNAPAYVSVNSEADATKQTSSGLVLTNFDFQLTGAPSDFAGKTVRVGIMEDVLGKDEWAADSAKALQLVQTTGTGAGDSGVQMLRKGGAATGSPVIYFFDINDIKPGDTFSIKALNNQSGTSANAGYVGPVSWDISSKAASK